MTDLDIADSPEFFAGRKIWPFPHKFLLISKNFLTFETYLYILSIYSMNNKDN